jgi:hypothetical protein
MCNVWMHILSAFDLLSLSLTYDQHVRPHRKLEVDLTQGTREQSSLANCARRDESGRQSRTRLGWRRVVKGLPTRDWQAPALSLCPLLRFSGFLQKLALSRITDWEHMIALKLA